MKIRVRARDSIGDTPKLRLVLETALGPLRLQLTLLFGLLLVLDLELCFVLDLGSVFDRDVGLVLGFWLGPH